MRRSLLFVLVSCLSHWQAAFSQTERAPIVIAKATLGFAALSDYPRLAPDLRGGAYVVFRSTREGKRHSNLFAQHVRADGSLHWSSLGVAVFESENVQLDHRVFEDGQGGLLIAWEERPQQATAGQYLVYAFDPQGRPRWPGPVALTGNGAAHYNSAFTLDFQGGLYCAWESPSENQIRVQHITREGQRAWTEEGKPVSDYPGARRRSPQLVSTPGQGVSLVYQESRDNKPWIFLTQRFDDRAAMQWIRYGAEIQPPAGIIYTNPVLLSDGFGGIMCAFEASATGSSDKDLHLLRVSHQGTVRYSTPFAEGYGNQQNPRLIRTAGELWIVWEDTRRESVDLHAMRYSIDTGKRLEAPEYVAFSVENGDQQAPQAFFGFALDGLTAVWADTRAGGVGLYAQRLSSDASPAWLRTGQPVAMALGQRQAFDGLGDERGGAWVAWISPDGTSPVVQHLDIKGLPQFPADGLPLVRPGGTVHAKLDQPAVASGKHNDAYIAWEDYRAGERNPDIYLQRLDASGRPYWPEGGIVVSNSGGFQSLPVLLPVAGGVYIGWIDRQPGLDENLFLQFVDTTGLPAWQAGGIRLCSAPRSQTGLRLARIGLDDCLAVWTDARDFARSGFDIYHQRIDRKSQLYLGQDGALLANGPEYQTGPEVMEDGFAGVYVTWMDQRKGQYQICAQRLDPAGLRLWPSPGILLSPSAENQRYPKPARLGDQLLVTWSQDRSDISQSRTYLQALEPSGAFSWGSTARPLTLTYGSQTMPQLCVSGMAAVLGWLDQRNERSSGFNFYTRRLNFEGTSRWPEGGLSLGKFLQENARTEVMVSTDGRFTYSLWSEYATQRPIIQYARASMESGDLLWRQFVTPADADQLHPRLLRLGSGKIAAVWVNQNSAIQRSELLCLPLD